MVTDKTYLLSYDLRNIRIRYAFVYIYRVVAETTIKKQDEQSESGEFDAELLVWLQACILFDHNTCFSF